MDFLDFLRSAETDIDAFTRSVVLRNLAEHFRHHELKKKSGIGVKAEETFDTSEHLLDKWVLPRWGDSKAAEIKPLEIEAWFETLISQPQGKKKSPLTWASVVKMRSVMSQVYKHSQRHELIPAAIGKDGRPTNPVLLARSESGSNYEAVVVTPEQMIVILNELDRPETRLEWALALLHAATALRPEEAFGLKWVDIDWQNCQIHIRRAWSKGKETAGKNRGSMTQVVMPSGPGPCSGGMASRVALPSRLRLGVRVDSGEGQDSAISKCCWSGSSSPCGCQGWRDSRGVQGALWMHNLRHSLATFFASKEVTLPVIQSILRHTKPSTTARYTHRVDSVQLAAQAKFLEEIKVTTPAV